MDRRLTEQMFFWAARLPRIRIGLSGIILDLWLTLVPAQGTWIVSSDAYVSGGAVPILPYQGIAY